MAKKGRGELG